MASSSKGDSRFLSDLLEKAEKGPEELEKHLQTAEGRNTLFLGSPVVPFSLLLVQGSLISNLKEGAPITPYYNVAIG